MDVKLLSQDYETMPCCGYSQLGAGVGQKTSGKGSIYVEDTHCRLKLSFSQSQVFTIFA